MKQKQSLNLFIASAGTGTRLRPVTNTFPKPLLPVAGIPVVERLLHSILASLNSRNLAMNLHHKPELFRKWAQELKPGLPRPTFFYEEKVMETGGAITNAREFFRMGICLPVNGDILTEFDWNAFTDDHRQSGKMVTLAIQDRSHERRVGVASDGRLLCIDEKKQTPGMRRWLGYACAAFYEPEFLNCLPEGESHVPPFWVKAAGETGCGSTYVRYRSQFLDRSGRFKPLR